MTDAIQVERVAEAAIAVVGAADVVADARADGRRRRVLLEERVADVKRWMGAAFADGRDIEAAFRRVQDSMTPEEREEFLADFLASCGVAVRDAGRRMHDAFTESIGNGGRNASRAR